MNPAYKQWIHDNAPEDPTGKCSELTTEMQSVFPELRRIRGHFVCGTKQYPHWWLETADGEIVDPSKRQFGHMVGFYEPHDEARPEPTGICPNCSGYVYDGGTVCGDVCEQQYVAYVMGAWRR